MGVCEDLVICGVKNPESVPDETLLKARGIFSSRVKIMTTIIMNGR